MPPTGAKTAAAAAEELEGEADAAVAEAATVEVAVTWMPPVLVDGAAALEEEWWRVWLPWALVWWTAVPVVPGKMVCEVTKVALPEVTVTVELAPVVDAAAAL